jgi:hypothetical protein
MEHHEMSTTPTGQAIISTAIEFIRVGGQDGDGCIVSVSELFEELEDKFGDQFRLSPEQLKLLDLVESVAADPRVALLSFDGIHFGWAGENNIGLAEI